MNLNKKFISQVLIAVFLIPLPLILPLKAVSQSQRESHPLEGIFGPEREAAGGRTWEEIEIVFLNKSSLFERPKRSGGSRSGHEESTEFCPISPQGLIENSQNPPENTVNNPIEIWSNRPLFIWQKNNVKNKAVVVYSAQGEQELWSQEVTGSDHFIQYNNQTPLQPGVTYQWSLSEFDSPFQSESVKIPFKVMEAEKREKMAQEIQVIEQQLEGESKEKIALGKANYFIAKNLWSDALQVMFSVNNPSAELQETIEKIKSHNFCPPQTDSTSVIP